MKRSYGQAARRRLCLESLECRCLLAGDAALGDFVAQNPAEPADVDGDGAVAPRDALLVINQLWGQAVPHAEVVSGPAAHYLDVNGDRAISEADVEVARGEIHRRALAAILAAWPANPIAAAPLATAPLPTAPGMTAPGMTAPGMTAPGMTAPGMTAPGWGGPGAGGPGGSGSGLPPAPTPDDAWFGPAPSLVGLVVDDAAAAEENEDPGQITLSRSAPTDKELTVRLHLVLGQDTEHAATAGDFRGLSSSVTFPAGVASVTLVVTPVDDAIIEQNELLGFWIVEPSQPLTTEFWSPPYQVDPERSSGEIVIEDNEWRWVPSYKPGVDPNGGAWFEQMQLTEFPLRTLGGHGSWSYGPQHNSVRIGMQGGMTTQLLAYEFSYSVKQNLNFGFSCDPTTGVISGGPAGAGVTRDGPVEGGISYDYQINDAPGDLLHTVEINAINHVGGGGSYTTGFSGSASGKGFAASLIFSKSFLWGKEITEEIHASLFCRKGPDPQ